MLCIISNQRTKQSLLPSLLNVVVHIYCMDVLSVARSQSIVRAKRVLYGIAVTTDYLDYPSLHYLVWIGNGHECDIPVTPNYDVTLPIPNVVNLVCAPSPQHLRCGGSLLTTNVVQTACHCTSTFEKDSSQISSEVGVWENYYPVYSAAKLIVERFRNGVRAKKYINHPKCYWLNGKKPILYDYSLIILKEPLTGDSTYDVKTAPVYKESVLAEMWTRYMSKSTVCMFVGFGYYLMINEHTSNPLKSNIMMHGWNMMLDYESCFEKTDYNPIFSDVKYNYSEQATWVCIVPLPNRKDRPAEGDSGGPLTCDNQYFGVLSQGKFVNNEHVAMPMCTAFSIMENAVEHRLALTDEELIPIKSHYLYGPNSKNYRPSSPPFGRFPLRPKSCQNLLLPTSAMLYLSFILGYLDVLSRIITIL